MFPCRCPTGICPKLSSDMFPSFHPLLSELKNPRCCPQISIDFLQGALKAIRRRSIWSGFHQFPFILETLPILQEQVWNSPVDLTFSVPLLDFYI